MAFPARYISWKFCHESLSLTYLICMLGLIFLAIAWQLSYDDDNACCFVSVGFFVRSEEVDGGAWFISSGCE